MPDEPHLEKPAGARVWRTYVWVVRPDGARKRRYVSTGCRSRKAARKRALEIEIEHTDPHAAIARRVTLAEAIGLLIVECESSAKAGNLADETVEFYRWKAAALVAHFGPKFLLSGISSSAPVDEFVTARRGNVGEGTIGKELLVLRMALTLARRRRLWGGIVEDVLPERFNGASEARERVVSVEELQVLLGRLEQDNAARCAWMVASSGEWGASTRALRADVAGAEVLVRGTKTEWRERTVPLATSWQRSLMAYALENSLGQGGLLFRVLPRNALFQDLRRACGGGGFQPGGLAPVSANDLRRTCATWLLAEGASFDDVAKVLGHVDTRMLHRVYGRISTDELRARLQGQILRSRVVAESAGNAGTDGTAGKSGEAMLPQSGDDGVADGARTRNTWSHSPSWLWPKGRRSHRFGLRRKTLSSKSVAGREV